MQPLLFQPDPLPLLRIVQIQPVVDPTLRGLCVRPYPGHPHGCPNFGKKPGCPPQTPLLTEIFDLDQPCYAIVNLFELATHIQKMKEHHPNWTQAQLSCCLYWQQTARKQLERGIAIFSQQHSGYRIERCPEAMGLNVTQTLAEAGVRMEWPPQKTALQVAFAGKEGSR